MRYPRELTHCVPAVKVASASTRGVTPRMRISFAFCGVLVASGALLASSASAADAKPRVLVLEPASEVVDKPTVNTIASLMLVELSKNPGLDVISASDVKRLAELEGEKQSMGCADSSCLAELAGAMGARYVVFGDVGKLGKLIILNLNLFDSAKATAVNRTTVQATGVEDLPAKLGPGVRELVAPLFGAPANSAPVEVAKTEEPPKKEEASSSSGPSPALTWGLIGGGLVVMAGGGVFDLLSPSSNNKGVDALDFVGPSAMVVGIGAAAAGAILMATGGSDG